MRRGPVEQDHYSRCITELFDTVLMISADFDGYRKKGER